jgi:hypothetical protein
MRIDRTLIATGLVLAVAAHRLAAQAPITAGRDDSLARVIALSPPDELRRRVGQAAADEQAARQLLSQARQEEQRVQALIDIRRLEIKTLEKRLDLAKKEKRESDRKSLEDARKPQELALRMLERWKEVHSVTIRTAELTRDAARESRTAAEAELRLLDLRGTAAGSTEADSAVRAYQSGQQEENLIRQTRVVLEARRSEADLRRQLAERQRDLAEKQLALIEAQLAVRYLR